MKDAPDSFHIAFPGCSELPLTLCKSEKRTSYRNESFVNAQLFISDWEIITLDQK